MKTTRPAKQTAQHTVTPVDMAAEYATYAEAEATRKAKETAKPPSFLSHFKGTVRPL